MNRELELLQRKFERERDARIQAEKLLEEKSLELYKSNVQLKTLNNNLEEIAKERFKKLVEAEKEYEFLVESINDMIFRLKLDGKIYFANQVVSKLFGINKSELLGINIIDFLPAEQRNGIRIHFFREFLKRNCISYYELSLTNRYNQLIWLGLNVHFSSDKCKSCTRKQHNLALFTQSMKADSVCDFNEIIIVAHDITSQKIAQFNLEKSEKKYRELTEFLPEMICEVDSKAVLKYANQFAIHKFGFTEEEVWNSKFNILQIFPARFRKTIFKNFQEIYKTGKNFSSEYFALKKNGEEFPVLVYTSPIYENVSIIGVRGVMIDITERKKNEIEIAHNLRQQEILSKISLNYNSFEGFDKKTKETLRIIGLHTQVSRVYIFENSPDNLFTSNTYEWCNTNIEAQIDELQNIPFELIPSWMKILKNKGMVFSENIRELPQDIFEILEPQNIISIIVFPLKAGKKIIGFIGFDECVTVRKWTKSEIELLKIISNIISNAFQRNKIQTELINSESENRIIINSIPDVILQIDKTGIIKSIKSSQTFNLLHRFDPKGDNTIYTVFNEKISKSFEKAILQCIKTGSYQIDFQHVLASFIEFYEARMVKLNLNEILVIIRNVTEQRENEKQLQIAKNKAEEASKSKSEFLANVSHEIRTPLNAILGFSQWLYDETSIKQHKEYLSTILLSGKNLLTLINDILDLSKIESGKIDFEMQPMSYHEIINDIKLIFQQKVEQKGLSFIINTDTSVPEYIYMDELRFYQIIFNIVSNAIKFTSRGYVQISAFGVPTGNENEINLNIIIEDSGIGIEEDQQQIIFESFTQQSGQSNRNYEGTGLGLSIVNGLIKQLNGAISVTSKKGKGSAFTLTFHQLKVNYADFRLVDIKEEKRNFILESCTIMIVDDINYNIIILKKLINSDQVTFLEANSGTEALSRLNDQKPDLIFMDIRMPGMSGFDVVEIIKKDKNLSDIPIIAFTASTAKHKNDKIDRLFDGYIQKPVFKSDIDSVLLKFLKYKMEDGEAKKIDLSESDNEMTEENEIILPELIQELETVHWENWKKIKDKLIIYEIEDFRNKLYETGFQYSCKFIIRYCNDLDIGLQSFDIEMIEQQINGFPAMVDNLRSFKPE